MRQPCPICGNLESNKIHAAREMMFGTRDRFDYEECGSCGTVRLLNVPDLQAYYPRDYYSFQTDKPQPSASLKDRFIARLMGRYLLTGRGSLGSYLSGKKWDIRDKFPVSLREFPAPLKRTSSILDFGCGAGDLLRTLSAFGFTNLTGADPYIESDLRFPGVNIFKKGFAELDGKFDLIMLHHSFEHLPDPAGSLLQIQRLLADDGTVLIRIPVVNYAWERYGVNWVQLDPPRHLFLFTERSFKMLAAKAGFDVIKVDYDSEAFQFHGSEQYALDIPMCDPRTFRGATGSSIFNQQQFDEWIAMAAKLNSEGRGDQACFYLKRNTETAR